MPRASTSLPPSPYQPPVRRFARWRRVRRRVLAHRRPLAALSAAAAVLATLQATSTPPPERTLVVTAAHDVGAGAVLTASDLRRTAFAPANVPAAVWTDEAEVVGRTTAGPLLRGEPVTSARLVSGRLLRGYPGLGAVPVRIGDPGAVRLLRVGDRVNLLAADPQGRSQASVLAVGVPVLAIPRADTGLSETSTGGLVLLGLDEGDAVAVAQASVSEYLSVVLTR